MFMKTIDHENLFKKKESKNSFLFFNSKIYSHTPRGVKLREKKQKKNKLCK